MCARASCPSATRKDRPLERPPLWLRRRRRCLAPPTTRSSSARPHGLRTVGLLSSSSQGHRRRPAADAALLVEARSDAIVCGCQRRRRSRRGSARCAEVSARGARACRFVTRRPCSPNLPMRAGQWQLHRQCGCLMGRPQGSSHMRIKGDIRMHVFEGGLCHERLRSYAESSTSSSAARSPHPPHDEHRDQGRARRVSRLVDLPDRHASDVLALQAECLEVQRQLAGRLAARRSRRSSRCQATLTLGYAQLCKGRGGAREAQRRRGQRAADRQRGDGRLLLSRGA